MQHCLEVFGRQDREKYICDLLRARVMSFTLSLQIFFFLLICQTLNAVQHRLCPEGVCLGGELFWTCSLCEAAVGTSSTLWLCASALLRALASIGFSISPLVTDELIL